MSLRRRVVLAMLLVGQGCNAIVEAEDDHRLVEANAGAGTAGLGMTPKGAPAMGGAATAVAAGASGAGSGVPPSCNGLAATCGLSGKVSCCASSLVPGGTFNRSNDANYLATVSDFRLDKYEVTVGRFRKFVAAYSQNMIAAGAGKNANTRRTPGGTRRGMRACRQARRRSSPR